MSREEQQHSTKIQTNESCRNKTHVVYLFFSIIPAQSSVSQGNQQRHNVATTRKLTIEGKTKNLLHRMLGIIDRMLKHSKTIPSPTALKFYSRSKNKRRSAYSLTRDAANTTERMIVTPSPRRNSSRLWYVQQRRYTERYQVQKTKRIKIHPQKRENAPNMVHFDSTTKPSLYVQQYPP